MKAGRLAVGHADRSSAVASRSASRRHERQEALALQRLAGNEGVRALLDGGGRPLDPSVRDRFEALFGQDFGAVRVHHDIALRPDLLALARGEQVALSPAVRGLGPARSNAVLAHELAHVVQQRLGATRGAAPAHALEADANRAATAVAHGAPATVSAAGAVAAAPMTWKEARQQLWSVVPEGVQPALRPLAQKAAAAMDTVVPPSAQLPPVADQVVQGAVSGAHTVQSAVAGAESVRKQIAAIGPPQTQPAKPTSATGVIVGKARDRIMRNIGQGKGVALELANVADTLIWLPHVGRESAWATVDQAEKTGAMTKQQADLARAAIKGVWQPYDSAVGLATEKGLVQIDDVTRAPSIGGAVGGLYDKVGEAVDRQAAKLGAAPEQALVFTEMDIGELKGTLGANIAMSLIGGKEAEVALKLLGAAGAIQSLVVHMQRNGWRNLEFALRVLGVVSAVLGLKNARFMGKVTKIIIAAGTLASVFEPMLKLYKDWTDPALAADPRRRQAVLHHDLKEVVDVVLNAIQNAVHQGMSGKTKLTADPAAQTASGHAQAGPAASASVRGAGPTTPAEAPHASIAASGQPSKVAKPSGASKPQEHAAPQEHATSPEPAHATASATPTGAGESAAVAAPAPHAAEQKAHPPAASAPKALPDPKSAAAAMKPAPAAQSPTESFGAPLVQDAPVRYRSAAKAAKGAQEAGLTNENRPGLQSHSASRSVRKQLQKTGTESAHLLPQAIGAHIPGYNARRALTILLDRNVHQRFDQGWVHHWKHAVRTGQKLMTQQVYEMISAALKNVPDSMLSKATKDTLDWQLHMELYVKLGLQPDEPILLGTAGGQVAGSAHLVTSASPSGTASASTAAKPETTPAPPAKATAAATPEAVPAPPSAAKPEATPETTPAPPTEAPVLDATNEAPPSVKFRVEEPKVYLAEEVRNLGAEELIETPQEEAKQELKKMMHQTK